MKSTPLELATALSAKADVCLDLAQAEHTLAEKLHEGAARQQDIAGQQHVNADKLDCKADKLKNLGNSLEDAAVEIVGETQVVQRGR